MKGNYKLILTALVLGTVALLSLSYFGIGENHFLGVQNIRQGLDLSGGVTIVYEADTQEPDKEKLDGKMDAAVSMLRKRLDRKGYTEAEAVRRGEKRIQVDIPGVEDAETAMKDIGQTAQLQFVDENGNVLLTGSDVVEAKMEVQATQRGGVAQPLVSLTFTEEGREKFADATTKNVEKTIRIILDGAVVSEPMVREPLTDGKAQITGIFSAEEAGEMAALINAGSLPFALNVLEMNNIGAKLGANALETSLFAGAVGIALVLIFMMAVYKVSGVAADWALLIYVGLDLVMLSALQVTLTLPGIAGIILSVGMAVDANVIIFERIKEELINGKTLRSAMDSGFSRAFPAILDGNITTLIAAAVLYWMGNGTVRGFAQTLMIGILLSMFTALVITRLILKGFAGAGINNPKLYGLKVSVKEGFSK